MTKGPRTILWDIETTHNLAAVFRLCNDDYIPPQNIVQERYIVCAAWKELNQTPTHAVSVLDHPALYKRDPHNDEYVCRKLHQVLSSADILIAHNGDQYDLKFAEARMLVHDLSPLPPILSIDTLKAARNRFLFNSNKLDYLGQILHVGRKVETKTGLWMDLLVGDEATRKATIRAMVEYNKGDVELLERVFLKLRPYIANHVNRQLFDTKDGCPRCGSLKVQSRGTHKALTRTYQRYQCISCGGWFRALKPATPSTRTRVL